LFPDFHIFPDIFLTLSGIFVRPSFQPSLTGSCTDVSARPAFRQPDTDIDYFLSKKGTAGASVRAPLPFLLSLSVVSVFRFYRLLLVCLKDCHILFGKIDLI